MTQSSQGRQKSVIAKGRHFGIQKAPFGTWLSHLACQVVSLLPGFVTHGMGLILYPPGTGSSSCHRHQNLQVLRSLILDGRVQWIQLSFRICGFPIHRLNQLRIEILRRADWQFAGLVFDMMLSLGYMNCYLGRNGVTTEEAYFQCQKSQHGSVWLFEKFLFRSLKLFYLYWTLF